MAMTHIVCDKFQLWAIRVCRVRGRLLQSRDDNKIWKYNSERSEQYSVYQSARDPRHEVLILARGSRISDCSKLSSSVLVQAREMSGQFQG